jgi:hypothetical protein
MIWRFAKDYNLPKFLPHGSVKEPVIAKEKPERSKNIAILS